MARQSGSAVAQTKIKIEKEPLAKTMTISDTQSVPMCKLKASCTMQSQKVEDTKTVRDVILSPVLTSITNSNSSICTLVTHTDLPKITFLHIG